MNTPIAPAMRGLASRLPEQGRIRFGIKTGKAMKAIDTFRLTSQDREAIVRIAELYGGTPKPWEDPKAAPGQWEVITEANELSIVLPPDPLGDSPVYEQWGGGGINRRCFGGDAPDVCTVYDRRGKDATATVQGCQCVMDGALGCKPKLRLSVVLPDVRFGGVWRLDTSSWSACREIPQMVATIQALQALDQHKGMNLTRGVLGLKHDIADGGRKKFVYPVLRVNADLDQIIAGGAGVTALADGANSRRAVPAASDAPALAAADEPIEDVELYEEASVEVIDDGPTITDAEVVEDIEPPDWTTLAEQHDLTTAAVLVRARTVAKDHGLNPPKAIEEVQAITDGGFIRDLHAAVVGG